MGRSTSRVLLRRRPAGALPAGRADDPEPGLPPCAEAASGKRLLLRVEEAAALLGLSRRALYRLVAEHRLPEGVVVRLGRSVRFARPALLRWLGAADDHGDA